MTRKALALAGPLLVAFAASAAVVFGASGPTVSFTSPTAAQRISQHHEPYTAVAGSASFATPTAGTTRFYLRRDGCGTSNDNPHLSIVNGTDAGDGCGLVVTSGTGLGGTVDQGLSVDYPSSDGMPLTLDGSRPVTGTIDVANTGGGLVTVSVDLEALVGGNGIDVGTDSESVVATPDQSNVPVTFTIQPNGTLDQTDLSGLDLRVHVSGPYVASGFIGNSGKSFMDVPSWSASFGQSVQVSVDDSTFANAVPARIDGTAWSVAVPTPAPGKHVLYARATQGFDTGSTASQTLTVTK
jgi:hypothetical protein